MLLPISTSWPLWCGCILMFAAAAVERTTKVVPNVLSVLALAAGLLVALIFGKGGPCAQLEGGIGSSLGVAGATFGMLLVVWLQGLMGGGCLKMQTAFGAWLGCALPFPKAFVLSLAAVVSTLVIYGVAECVVRTFPPAEDGSRRHAELSQFWISCISVTAVLTVGLLRMP